MHTTNYINTFIEVGEDCPVEYGKVPVAKGDARTIAEVQYELISNNPYKFTSDDVLFTVYAQRKDLVESEHQEAREQFFSKGQACLRASPLTKNYGFGVHSDAEGKVAIFGRETEEYQQFLLDPQLKKVKAMRNSRK